MEVAQAMDDSGTTKRRKVGNGELRLSKTVRIMESSEDVVNTSVEKKELSGDIQVSCCLIDGSVMEKLKCADLEERVEIETNVKNNLDRTESFTVKQIKSHILSPNLMAAYFITPTNGESLINSEKQPAPVASRRTIPPEKTPPAAELDEFFSAAEKNLSDRFKDKYNYDIVNDVPLKGRFEWIQLKQ
ncbi:hypothetical protein QVD17_09954 [Tagetes erecta]|uniref:Cyclin-dependent kinase inhibitor domain-containing protein n=1 Tax=Tagetes erecta TaxID=13708 RepID=A0AAD8L1X3_TARER|nr:hypothetical protein QVD17_09954 [Tagetes erecta]